MAGGDRMHFVTVIFLLKCQPNYMGRLVAIFFGILKFCAHPRRVWFSNWRRKWWCSMMMMNIPIRYGHIVWYIDTQDNIGAHEYWISSTKDKKTKYRRNSFGMLLGWLRLPNSQEDDVAALNSKIHRSLSFFSLALVQLSSGGWSLGDNVASERFVTFSRTSLCPHLSIFFPRKKNNQIIPA